MRYSNKIRGHALKQLFYNTKLSKTIIFSLLLGLSFPILLGTYYIKQNLQVEMEKDLRSFHHYITNTIAKSSSTIVWDFRKNMAADLLEPIFEDPRITHITIWDESGVFIELKKEAIEGNILSHKASINMAGKEIGQVEVDISDALHQRSLENLNYLLFGIVFTQITLALLLLLPVLYFKLIQPISRLIEQSKEIAQNQLHHPFLWNQNDELGRLGQSFEVARIALLSSFDQIRASRETIRSLLDNSGEGFFSFDHTLTIDPNYSRECHRIFDQDISEISILLLLAPNDSYRQNQLELNLNAIFSTDFHDTFKINMLMSLLPTEYVLHSRFYAATYTMLENQKIMMRLSDITAEKALEAKLKEEQQRLRFLVSVIQARQDYFDTVRQFQHFLQEGFSQIANSDSPLEKKVAEIYRQIHTFKGVFAQMDSPGLPQKLHHLEETISRHRQSNLEESVLGLIEDRLSNGEHQEQLEQELNIIRTTVGKDFIENKGSIMVPESELRQLEAQFIKKFTSETPNTLVDDEAMQLLRQIRRLRYVSLHSLLQHYPKNAFQLARRLDKEIYPFVVEGGNNIFLDPDLNRPFMKTMVHLFRNAVDHGIESPEERLESGKEEIGQITCTVIEQNDTAIITLQDDGGGIDPQKLIDKANSMGIPVPENPLLLIFEDAFSTKESVTELSGRGVGLSALKAELEKLGGHIEVQSEIGKGTTFRLFLPI